MACRSSADGDRRAAALACQAASSAGDTRAWISTVRRSAISEPPRRSGGNARRSPASPAGARNAGGSRGAQPLPRQPSCPLIVRPTVSLHRPDLRRRPPGSSRLPVALLRCRKALDPCPAPDVRPRCRSRPDQSRGRCDRTREAGSVRSWSRRGAIGDFVFRWSRDRKLRMDVCHRGGDGAHGPESCRGGLRPIGSVRAPTAAHGRLGSLPRRRAPSGGVFAGLTPDRALVIRTRPRCHRHEFRRPAGARSPESRMPRRRPSRERDRHRPRSRLRPPCPRPCTSGRWPGTVRDGVTRGTMTANRTGSTGIQDRRRGREHDEAIDEGAAEGHGRDQAGTRGGRHGQGAEPGV